MNKLKELYATQFNYDMCYDYDDMKLAIVCDNFIDQAFTDILDFEDVIRLATWVRVKYNQEFDTLSATEKGYVQEYAIRILYENADEIFEIIRSNYE